VIDGQLVRAAKFGRQGALPAARYSLPQGRPMLRVGEELAKSWPNAR